MGVAWEQAAQKGSVHVCSGALLTHMECMGLESGVTQSVIFEGSKVKGRREQHADRAFK